MGAGGGGNRRLGRCRRCRANDNIRDCQLGRIHRWDESRTIRRSAALRDPPAGHPPSTQGRLVGAIAGAVTRSCRQMGCPLLRRRRQLPHPFVPDNHECHRVALPWTDRSSRSPLGWAASPCNGTGVVRDTAPYSLCAWEVLPGMTVVC